MLAALDTRASSAASTSELLRRLQAAIARIHEKLDQLLARIETAEQQIQTKSPAEMKLILDKIVDELNALEAPIRSLFDDVDQLKQARHPDAADYHAQ